MYILVALLTLLGVGQACKDVVDTNNQYKDKIMTQEMNYNGG